MKQPVVTIYGRTGCHLCEDAVNLISPLAKSHDFVLQEKLIDGDSELEDLYGQLIPVIHINGKYFSHFRIDLIDFKSSLEKHRQHQ
jgi:glutaredoxin